MRREACNAVITARHPCIHCLICGRLTPGDSAGDWFCSEVCSSIWDRLNATVAAGLTPLEPPDYPPGYTIQMLRGRVTIDKPNAAATNDAIDIAQNVLQESFDPIIDKATKENLLLLMTKAEVKGEYDYRGMYTALLSHEVCPELMSYSGRLCIAWM